MPTTTVKNLALSSVLKQLVACSRSQSTGRLDISDGQNRKWSVYLGLGRIVWVSGGCHPYRRFKRLLAQHCPQVKAKNLKQDLFEGEGWDYRLLTLLARRQQITLAQVRQIVANVAIEVLFDLLQQGNFKKSAANSFRIQWHKGVRPSQKAMLPAKCVLDLQTALKRSQQLWEQWKKAGLQRVRPDFAPKLCKPQQLRQQMSPGAYKNLVALTDGKRTLRDLGFALKSQPMQVMRSLLPYIRQGTIELIEVPDRPAAKTPSKTPKKNLPKEAPKTRSPNSQFLVACIDDSPQTCRILERIFTGADYKFISIQDSTLALPILLEAKPNIIFLDLVMPIVNGYELCSQIRRISFFQEIPIVILTGREGVVDRMRMKMMGASDYMQKPVNAQQILTLTQKYL